MNRQEATGGLPGLRLDRRSVLKGVGAGSLAVAGGGLLAACGSSIKGAGSSGKAGTINIGFITPLTGTLSDFGASDRFVVNTIRGTSAFKNGFKVGGKKYDVTINVQDSQSSSTRAGQLAAQLAGKVDIILTTSAPETTNPVAVQCEKQGTPCLSTVVPWESWYAGLGGNPLKPTTKFDYCTMFFFGLNEFLGCFHPMWQRISNNRHVGCQYPNDADGNAFRDGFEPLIKSVGYKVFDAGAYPDGQTDYTSMITYFKSNDCEIFSNCPLPPDFNTFWKQANQQGYKPRLATVAKVLLFAPDTTVLGPLVNNIATDSWWGPYMPYKSSLTGQSAASLAAAYESSTGLLWTQSIGSSYALFEIAKEAFSKVSDPHDAKDVAAALHTVNYTGMNGPINFAASNAPAPGVAIIEPVGVQWKKTSGKYPFEMKVVDNSLNKSVPIGASLEPTYA